MMVVELGGDVEDQSDGVSDLAEDVRTHVAADVFYSRRRDSSHVLTLGGRDVKQPGSDLVDPASRMVPTLNPGALLFGIW